MKAIKDLSAAVARYLQNEWLILRSGKPAGYPREASYFRCRWHAVRLSSLILTGSVGWVACLGMDAWPIALMILCFMGIPTCFVILRDRRKGYYGREPAVEMDNERQRRPLTCYFTPSAYGGAVLLYFCAGAIFSLALARLYPLSVAVILSADLMIAWGVRGPDRRARRAGGGYEEGRASIP
jgi:hypothetical protein